MAQADDDTRRSHGQAAGTEALTGAAMPVPDQTAPWVDHGDETGEFRPGSSVVVVVQPMGLVSVTVSGEAPGAE